MLLALLVPHAAVAAIVWEDARRRDWNGDTFADRPWKWALGALLLWYVTLPRYLQRRGARPLVGEA